MSQNNILLADQRRVASESRSRVVGNATLEEHYQRLSDCPIGVLPLPLASYLTHSGNGIELANDGSSVINYDLTPGATEVYRISKLTALLVVASEPALNEFGNLTALSNGLILKTLDDDADILDLTAGQPIISNNDFATLGTVTIGNSNSTYHVKAEIVPEVPLRIDGAQSEVLRAVLQDDLSSLTRFRILATGLREETLT